MHGAAFPQEASQHNQRMNAAISTTRHDSTAKLDNGQGLLSVNRLAEAIKRRWQQGEPPNLTGVLERHPELQRDRSVVLNLAYAEYRTRLQAGESIDAETFAQRFPSLERSLYLLIEVHGLLSQDPELQLLQENVAWPEAGSRFLQFDLTAEIGRGAFGRVFLANEPALGGRQVVVKVAPQGGGEAEIIGRLRHPNIVPIYSLQEDEATGLSAFCMPYLGRATLCDVLDQSFLAGHPPQRARTILDAVATVNYDLDSRDSPAPARILRRGSYVDGAIHLGAQLAEALAHSHGRGIYHRDLKPSNVLMTPEGRPLLLDFKISICRLIRGWRPGRSAARCPTWRRKNWPILLPRRPHRVYPVSTPARTSSPWAS
jgi:serine/threonine protein kinase